MAFEDTWEWNVDAQRAYEEIVEKGGRVSDAMRAFRTFLGHSDMMAYLAMMAPRLIELRRVLKETGSIYLHCDPTASHYLKLLMDSIFGPQFFRNEIIWQRTNSHNTAKQYGRIHDVLLFYAKTDSYCWNQISTEFGPAQLKRYKPDKNGRLYTGQDLTASRPNSKSGKFEWRGTMPPSSRGWGYELEQLEQWWEEGRILTKKDGSPRMDGLKVYLDDMAGKSLQSIWTDVPRIANTSPERLGYPTQKPKLLLERIITASSNEGDVVLDPFCGCGTAVEVAQQLDRRWIGIDVTHLAIGLIKQRLIDAFGESARATYEIIGEPVDLSGAQELATNDPYQFQWWALSLVAARPTEQKKGADRGIDGRLYFHDEPRGGKTKQIIFSVKAGHVQSAYVRDLRGVIERECSEIGVLICMEAPTKPMLKEAAEAGFYKPPGLEDRYPRLQILTIEDLLAGKGVQYPRMLEVTFKKAPKSRKSAEEQIPLAASESEDEGPF